MQIDKMSDRELINAAREYDRGMNEGGEGYNPYRSEIERRAQVAEDTRPKSRGERIAGLMHQLEIKDSPVAHEWGPLSPEQVAEIAGIRAEIARLQKEEQDEFATAWPRELTIARREEWNNRVKAGEITMVTEMRRQEERQGWSLADLRQAVKIHNL